MNSCVSSDNLSQELNHHCILVECENENEVIIKYCSKILKYNFSNIKDIENSPSVRFLKPKKENTISVDDFREIKDLTSLSTDFKKVFIIKNIENATISASNCMLKVFEEPNNNICFLIITKNTNSVLTTIRSRCVCFCEAKNDNGLIKNITDDFFNNKIAEKEIFFLNKIDFYKKYDLSDLSNKINNCIDRLKWKN